MLEFVDLNFLKKHENYSFSFTSKIVNNNQYYFTNYEYKNRPAFVASFNDGEKNAVIVLDKNVTRVESIINIGDTTLERTKPDSLPYFLYNNYFSNFNKKNSSDLLQNYQIFPCLEYSNIIIIPFDKRLEIFDKKSFLNKIGLYFCDENEKNIMVIINSLNTKILPFEVCRILNSYRRIKLDLINKTDTAECYPSFF